jgi:hypothetical protein
MPTVARGSFDVTLVPQPNSEVADAALLGRRTIDKVFRGDLQGTSKGEMLAGMTESTGAAAYVAVERVAGALGGREGTFLLLHRATMTRGSTGALSIVVAEGSGTGALVGISGTMSIEIKDGQHYYTFEYELPA